MEKVFQILAVFAVMMLVIYRFIRGRGHSYRPYEFVVRLRPPLPAEVEQRLIVAEHGEGCRLEMEDFVFCYRAEGSLTIYRRQQQGRDRQVQELAVPLDCTAVAMDPIDKRLYFEAGGYWFIYGQG
ncbi:MAG TPA: hypothetical protein VNU70_10510 [Puia sp.]|jgi:hypothetical protein|nr:hypothetical protein [Puia sp.]